MAVSLSYRRAIIFERYQPQRTISAFAVFARKQIKSAPFNTARMRNQRQRWQAEIPADIVGAFNRVIEVIKQKRETDARRE